MKTLRTSKFEQRSRVYQDLFVLLSNSSRNILWQRLAELLVKEQVPGTQSLERN